MIAIGLIVGLLLCDATLHTFALPLHRPYTAPTLHTQITYTHAHTLAHSRTHAHRVLQDGVVYDYVFDAEAEAWVNWLETPAGREEIPRGAAYHDIVVPTMDTVRARFFVDACAKAGTPLLISGTIPSVLLSRRLRRRPFIGFIPPLPPLFAPRFSSLPTPFSQDRLGRPRRRQFGRRFCTTFRGRFTLRSLRPFRLAPPRPTPRRSLSGRSSAWRKAPLVRRTACGVWRLWTTLISRSRRSMAPSHRLNCCVRYVFLLLLLLLLLVFFLFLCVCVCMCVHVYTCVCDHV